MLCNYDGSTDRRPREQWRSFVHTTRLTCCSRFKNNNVGTVRGSRPNRTNAHGRKQEKSKKTHPKKKKRNHAFRLTWGFFVSNVSCDPTEYAIENCDRRKIYRNDRTPTKSDGVGRSEGDGRGVPCTWPACRNRCYSCVPDGQ